MSEESKAKTQLNIRLKDMHGQEVFFKVLPTTTFRKILSAYCNKTGLTASAVRLLFEGEQLALTQSPKELEMENDDVIDVMVSQEGGM